MPKINPKAVLALAKGWAMAHVVAAVAIAAAIGFVLGLLIG